MSTLHLIRHAQASFFEEDYDQLSELGEAQAARLGATFAERGYQFDEVYCGPAKRHQRTAEIVGKHLRRAGLPWCEPTIVEGLNEHAADEFVRLHAETVVEAHPNLLPLVESHRSASEPHEIQRSFQMLFESCVRLWIDGKLAVGGVESWTKFQNGVRGALKTLTVDKPSGSRVVAFSSVGPMSALLQLVLKTPHDQALDLGWRLRNCAVCRFVFSSERITLDAFNDLSHLDDASLITYR
jgi:broad specificity phosphatase PhoE